MENIIMSNLNTSHVNVNLRSVDILGIQDGYLNTSHVNVNQKVLIAFLMA